MKIGWNRKLEYLATPFKPAVKYGIASTAFAAIMATESDGVTKNLMEYKNVIKTS